jgi:hypothetical protein
LLTNKPRHACPTTGATSFAFQSSPTYYSNNPWLDNPGFRVLGSYDLDPTHPWTWNGSGTAVPVGASSGSWIEDKGLGTWLVHVGAGDSGKVWMLGNPVSPVTVIGIPNMWSHNPWQVLQP